MVVIKNFRLIVTVIYSERILFSFNFVCSAIIHQPGISFCVCMSTYSLDLVGAEADAAVTIAPCRCHIWGIIRKHMRVRLQYNRIVIKKKKPANSLHTTQLTFNISALWFIVKRNFVRFKVKNFNKIQLTYKIEETKKKRRDLDLVLFLLLRLSETLTLFTHWLECIVHIYSRGSMQTHVS